MVKTENRVWTCHVCGDTFDTEADMIEHIDSEHPGSRPLSVEEQINPSALEPKVMPKGKKKKPTKNYDSGWERELPDTVRQSREITMEEVLAQFPDELSVSAPPPSLYLAGSLVNLKKIPVDWLSPDSKHDIDIIHRGEWDRRIIESLVARLPKWLSRKVRYHADKDGPIMGHSIPLYNKSFSKVKEEPKQVSPWEVQDSSLSGKPVLFKPFVAAKPRSGFGKNEFFDLDEMWEKFGRHHILKGITVEKKYDGRRFQAHIDKEAGEIKIFTEDRMRDRAEAIKPLADEILAKLNAKKAILDFELEAYDTGGTTVKSAQLKEQGRLVPREDTAAFTNGAISVELMDNAVAQVYDVLLVNDQALNTLGSEDRVEAVQSVVPANLRWWKAVPYSIARTREEFYSLVNKYASMEGSEGVVLKTPDSIYPIKHSGENRIKNWAKFKNLKEVDVMVVHSTAKKNLKTGEPMNVWMHQAAYEIPKDVKDKFYDSFVYKGKHYATIGRSYGSSTKVSKGDIITVMPIRIREYVKNGKRAFTWMFPYFKEKKGEKNNADTLTTIERIAKVGTKPLSMAKLSLEECSYWDNDTICPFRAKFKLPGELSDSEAELQEERLRFPVKCKFAYLYRCKFTKGYYYSKEVSG